MLDYIKIANSKIKHIQLTHFFLNPNTKRQILQKDHYGTLQIFFPNQIKLSASYFERAFDQDAHNRSNFEIENP